MEVVAYRSEPADTDMRIGRPVFRADVRDVKWKVRQTQFELETQRFACSSCECGSNWRKCRTVQPSGRTAAAIDGSFVIHGCSRVVEIELDIVFTSPNHFHRFSEFFRKHCS